MFYWLDLQGNNAVIRVFDGAGNNSKQIGSSLIAAVRASIGGENASPFAIFRSKAATKEVVTRAESLLCSRAQARSTVT
jgi:hypothetical protein